MIARQVIGPYDMEQELGLVGVAALLLVFMLFAARGFRISLACKDPFGKRLAAGLTALVCGQAAVNLAAVLGVAPLTGIPLPFFSYGGSFLLASWISIGILVSLSGEGRGPADSLII